MLILISKPEDGFQQYMAWMPEQEGNPITGVGNSPEEALYDLQLTLQRLINGEYEDEEEMMIAKELIPALYHDIPQVFIEYAHPLDLDFENWDPED